MTVLAQATARLWLKENRVLTKRFSLLLLSSQSLEIYFLLTTKGSYFRGIKNHTVKKLGHFQFLRMLKFVHFLEKRYEREKILFIGPKVN